MRNNAARWLTLFTAMLALSFLANPRIAAGADDDDPPARAARLSFAGGAVSFEPAGTDEWVDAVVNRPMTTGDKLWTDRDGRAEVRIDSYGLRLGPQTGFSFLNLDDNTVQIRLTEGSLNIRVRRLEDNDTLEIDTPNLAFNVLRPGSYRIDVNENGDTTVVSVRDGQGEVTGGGSAYPVHAGDSVTFSGTDQLSADVQNYEGNDDFDRWCSDRDRRWDRSTAPKYVSDDVVGYEDLDEYGGWNSVPEYGTVWFPRTTVAGWAPYRYGHWVWISPWGWTWVDDASWGFAPFHYGRWVTVGGVWGWVPCAPRAVVGVAYVRPVYAPALVAWVGGPHFSVGIGIGGGGGVGVAWFPLGPREVYVPSYHVSRTYVTNVNVSNTTVNNTVVNNYYNNVVVNKNVTNIKYVNQTAPNGVTATSQQNFTSAQPVGRNMIKVDQREVASAQVRPTTPTVAPQQRSVLGAGAAGAARPPARFQERPVVARTPPPPVPVSFVKQQQAIQANGGLPPAVSQMRQAQTENAPQARPNIKLAPPANAGMPQNIQANRPGSVQNNRGNRPGQQQTNVQNNSNKPPTPNNAVQPPPGNQPVNPPANNGRNKSYNDRPSTARPDGGSPNTAVNGQLDQKHQQQLEQLRQRQDQERQRIEQKQVQEQQKIQQKNAEDSRKQQVEQKQQQQLQQLEQKHGQQQEKLQQKQQQERQKQQERPKDKPSSKPPKDDKPPH